MLLSIYLIALLVGGFLLAMSMLGAEKDFDADVDIDIDADFDADADADGDVDHGGSGLDALSAWLPFASLRFWTFFAAFFGLTGVTMSLGKFAGQFVGLGLAVGVGYVCGAAMTRVIKKLSTERVDSSLARGDVVGSTAKVVLPVSPGDRGKIRIEIKGRVIELIAETEEDLELERGQTCIVYGIRDDGAAVVARAAELTE